MHEIRVTLLTGETPSKMYKVTLKMSTVMQTTALIT